MIEIKVTGVREASGQFGKYLQGLTPAQQAAREGAATQAGATLRQRLKEAGESRHSRYSQEDRGGSRYNGDPEPFAEMWSAPERLSEDNSQLTVGLTNTKRVRDVGGKSWSLLNILNAGTERHDYPIAPVLASMLRYPNRDGRSQRTSEHKVTAGGEWVFRQQVIHPGVEGDHFVDETIATHGDEIEHIAQKGANEAFVRMFSDLDEGGF